MTRSYFDTLQESLRSSPRRWLITGVAGFIGSNLLERLLTLNQEVVGLDNFATGHRENIDRVLRSLPEEQRLNFTFLEGDICDAATCRTACRNIDYVLHQAALGSVPRSIDNPSATNETNITGFLNMLIASRDANVKSFTYAASSSTYGDHPDLPKVEEKIGNPLSPYAVTKLVNELYAQVFYRCYDFNSIGLRYFNVFGKHQDPNGAYAAVIPKWISSILRKTPIYINGDGETSRDFCYIENAIQANLLAATAHPSAQNQVYNVAVGQRTTLNKLLSIIIESFRQIGVEYDIPPQYVDFRNGDVRHSQADISKASSLLHYKPTHDVHAGIKETVKWYATEKQNLL